MTALMSVKLCSAADVPPASALSRFDLAAEGIPVVLCPADEAVPMISHMVRSSHGVDHERIMWNH